MRYLRHVGLTALAVFLCAVPAAIILAAPVSEVPESAQYPMQEGAQAAEVSADSECGYACPIDKAVLLCDTDGAWSVWLMADQSVKVPVGACSREDLPQVFDRLGQPVGSDVIVVGEDD